MYRRTAIFVLALLLLVSLAKSSRPMREVASRSQVEVAEDGNPEKMGEGCEGDGEEECLMRRTLAAHVDYIYTNQKNP